MLLKKCPHIVQSGVKVCVDLQRFLIVLQSSLDVPVLPLFISLIELLNSLRVERRQRMLGVDFVAALTARESSAPAVAAVFRHGLKHHHHLSPGLMILSSRVVCRKGLYPSLPPPPRSAVGQSRQYVVPVRVGIGIAGGKIAISQHVDEHRLRLALGIRNAAGQDADVLGMRPGGKDASATMTAARRGALGNAWARSRWDSNLEGPGFMAAPSRLAATKRRGVSGEFVHFEVKNSFSTRLAAPSRRKQLTHFLFYDIQGSRR